MDSAIVVDRQARTAVATKFDAVRQRHGSRRRPSGNSRGPAPAFDCASRCFRVHVEQLLDREAQERGHSRDRARVHPGAREEKGKILVVAGPAIVHTGAAEHFEKLIQRGFVDLLFGGNALAAHDIENALFGTSLGVNVEHGAFTDQGSQNHIRAINAIRGAGGIRQAVANGLLKSGIMYTCVKNRVEFVLAGSIRDDGPLPEVITDVIEAQNAMRAKVSDVTIAMMMGTMLHSMAVGEYSSRHSENDLCRY